MDKKGVSYPLTLIVANRNIQNNIKNRDLIINVNSSIIQQ